MPDDLNEDRIKELSQLCRIELSNDEMLLLLKDLKQVVDYVAQLKEVDVTHLNPYSHLDVQEVSTLRDDDVKETLSRDEFLANAPDHVGGMVRVPPLFRQPQ